MSSNIIYTSIPAYLESCGTTEARIVRLEALLDKMLDAMDKAASTGHFEEYKLDTGQTRTEIRYRSLQELMNAYNICVMRLEREYSKVNARRTGRVFRLVDGRNLKGRF